MSPISRSRQSVCKTGWQIRHELMSADNLQKFVVKCWWASMSFFCSLRINSCSVLEILNLSIFFFNNINRRMHNCKLGSLQIIRLEFEQIFFSFWRKIRIFYQPLNFKSQPTDFRTANTFQNFVDDDEENNVNFTL